MRQLMLRGSPTCHALHHHLVRRAQGSVVAVPHAAPPNPGASPEVRRLRHKAFPRRFPPTLSLLQPAQLAAAISVLRRRTRVEVGRPRDVAVPVHRQHIEDELDRWHAGLVAPLLEMDHDIARHHRDRLTRGPRRASVQRLRA